MNISRLNLETSIEMLEPAIPIDRFPIHTKTQQIVYYSIFQRKLQDVKVVLRKGKDIIRFDSNDIISYTCEICRCTYYKIIYMYVRSVRQLHSEYPGLCETCSRKYRYYFPTKRHTEITTEQIQFRVNSVRESHSRDEKPTVSVLADPAIHAYNRDYNTKEILAKKRLLESSSNPDDMLIAVKSTRISPEVVSPSLNFTSEMMSNGSDSFDSIEPLNPTSESESNESESNESESNESDNFDSIEPLNRIYPFLDRYVSDPESPSEGLNLIHGLEQVIPGAFPEFGIISEWSIISATL